MNPTVVIGEGWSALVAVGFLTSAEKPVVWISGTGARMLAPLPFLGCGSEENGAIAWKALLQRLQAKGLLDLELGEMEEGCFLREFKNKSFRMPQRINLREESLWTPETRFIGDTDSRFERLSLGEIEESIRRALFEHDFVQRVEGVPVQSLQGNQPNETIEVILGDGKKVAASSVIFADRWSSLTEISELPKSLQSLGKGREPVSILQAVLNHPKSDIPAAYLTEGFFGPLHREVGEEFQRNVWGYFLDQGKRSVWSLMIASEEGEDNHQIAKRLRRMKQALEKMFSENFLASVDSEQVRFEESFIFSSGEVPKGPSVHPKNAAIHVVTDGFGPAVAASWVFEALSPMIETS